jgi:phosphoglycolate phosphatase
VAAKMKSKLVLFDIDGTLLTSGGAGERSLALALKDRFGIIDEELEGIEIAGRTDSGIARQIFAKHGIDDSVENLSAYYDSYLARLEQELPRSHGRLLPGILEMLEILRCKADVALALLTGNLSRGAEIKLSHYGVWEFFEFGAFADDHSDRNRLGPFAQARAFEKHGVRFAPESTFVIGDTPHDIDCGRAFGAKTVAIATGRHSRAELEAHAPDYVFDDLSDASSAVQRLGL